MIRFQKNKIKSCSGAVFQDERKIHEQLFEWLKELKRLRGYKEKTEFVLKSLEKVMDSED